MATTFATIREFVRAVLGDTDPVIQQYSNAVMNSHIRLLILQDGDSSFQENGTSETFTADLPQKTIAKTVYRVIRSLISPQHDTYSYKTAVLSVLRKGGVVQLLNHVDRQIMEIEGGSFSVSSDDYATALINGSIRAVNDISDAIGGP